MERGQIVALPTVVIPPENTPQKKRSETLIAHPRWRYIGPADTIRFEWQIGQWYLGTFDGITSRKYKTFSQPASMEMAEFSTSLPAISLSPLSPRAEPYICEILFKDKFSDLRVIVENCVKIIEVPPPSDLYLPAPGFEATPGTYDLGDKVPWTMVYQYKGKAQAGWLTISLGTGAYPSFFTKHTYPRVSVTFEEAMDWASGQLSGNFTLPTTLTPGQTYNVRAKLETADGVQETDTDWGVITIREVPVGITFQVSIWGIPDFGNYDYWACYYWDPGINDFVGKGDWYHSYDKITFSNVQPGGYLAVFLRRNTTVSPQYTSPTFDAVDGGSYTYDVEMEKIYG